MPWVGSWATASPIIVTAVIIASGLGLGIGLPVDNKAAPEPWGRVSAVLGWAYFAAWGMCCYPQMYHNCRRKSVVGLSFDFALYNWVGFLCFSAYNCGLYYSPRLQAAYAHTHGGNPPGVRINDVLFCLHATFWMTLGLVQIACYERGSQRVSTSCKVAIAAFFALACGYLYAVNAADRILSLKVALEKFQARSMLAFLYMLSYVKVLVTVVKYHPQVVLSCHRKSTTGFMVANVILDMVGGILCLSQQLVDAWATHDWQIITGNLGKLGVALVGLFYDVIMVIQHYVLYPEHGGEQLLSGFGQPYNADSGGSGTDNPDAAHQGKVAEPNSLQAPLLSGDHHDLEQPAGGAPDGTHDGLVARKPSLPELVFVALPHIKVS